jgi:hypothetical protein
MSAALVVLLVLALSLGGNAWQWHRNGVEHDARVKVEADLTTANNATKACNDSVTELERQARIARRREPRAAQGSREPPRAQESLAQQILSTPATVPGNDCQSARDRVVNWLKARKP